MMSTKRLPSQLIHNLYAENHQFLFNYAKRVIGNPDLAEEAVQETFAIACNKEDTLKTHPNPRGWLVVALKRTIQDMNKQRSQAAEIFTAYLEQYGCPPPDSQDPGHSHVIYSDLVNQDAFDLMLKVALTKCTSRDIAKDLNISVAAAKKRIYRARKAMQETLKK